MKTVASVYFPITRECNTMPTITGARVNTIRQGRRNRRLGHRV